MVKFYSELNAPMVGLVLAVIWSVCILIFSLAALLTKAYALDFIYLLKSVYPYYGLNVLGILLGVVYGFIDGFLLGFIGAWFYNKLIR